MTIKIVTLQYY